MGNTWKGISSDHLVQAELALLKRGGLQHEDFKFIEVKLDDDTDPSTLEVTENYIHSVEIRHNSVPQDKELPIMVLVHGYGAGSTVFFKILKDLSHYFQLYIVDLLGMGCSGRPQYKAFSPDLAEDFFVNSLKLWKEKVGIKKKFILAGHSLGGYVSSVYALRHPEDLERLLLLSPVGLPEKPDSFTHEEVAQRFNSFSSRMGARLILKLWEKNFTPFEVLRFSGSYGTKFFLKFYMGRRMKSVTDQEELLDMKNYLHQIFLRPGSGEYALNTILSPGSWAKNPLVHRLPALSNLPIGFYYGECDWMDPTAAHFLIQNGLLSKARLYGIEKADHHLYLDNPTDTVYKILLEVFQGGVSDHQNINDGILGNRDQINGQSSCKVADEYLRAKKSNESSQQQQQEESVTSQVIKEEEIEQQIIT